MSPLLGALAVVAIAAGLALGYVEYLNRQVSPKTHVPGTSAWPAHIALTAAVAVVVFGMLVARRRNAFRVRHPWSRATAAGLRHLARARGRTLGGTVRLVVAVAALALVYYCVARAAMQLTGGLDPSFTANAWGGPGYWGALYCHWLDAAVTVAVLTVVLHLALRRR